MGRDSEPGRADARPPATSEAPRDTLPRNSRSRVPTAARLRADLTTRLLHVFDAHGFERVMTPLLSDFQVLARGMSGFDREHSVRFIEAGTGDLVALRSDPTPQIAVMVAAGLVPAPADDGVVRACYAADVVRHHGRGDAAAEQHQAGVELIGEAGPGADAALLAICAEALGDVGLTGFRFDLAHCQIAHGVLDRLTLSGAERSRAIECLARKDRQGLETLVDRDSIATVDRTRALSLCDLYGAPAVLDVAEISLAPELTGLHELRAVVEAFAECMPQAAAHALVDLGEVRGFDYYSGLRFRVWAEGVAGPVARGGRYDDLLGHYGRSAPAVGFAIDLDALELALGRHGADATVAPARATELVIVGPQVTAHARRIAHEVAAAARTDGKRAWVKQGAPAEAGTIAARHGAQTFWIVDDDGGVRRIAGAGAAADAVPAATLEGELA